MTKNSAYTSQYGIEEIVTKYLGDKPGFFMEIGAWDGIHFSQTAWLEKNLGWKGVCVDPFPKNFDNRNCIVIPKAVVFEITFEDRSFLHVDIDPSHGGDVSYFSGFLDKLDVHKELVSKCDYSIVHVPQISVHDLFYGNEYCSVPSFIEFLSVDTEGSELEIFQGIDWNKFTFGVITYEHNGDIGKQTKIDRILSRAGYLRLTNAISREDDVYVKDNIAFGRSVYRDKDYTLD